MPLFEKCPICGGEVIERDVEKILKGGTNTAVLNVKAEVCLHCGERLYDSNTIRKFEEIRKKLEINNLENLIEVGKALQVV